MLTGVGRHGLAGMINGLVHRQVDFFNQLSSLLYDLSQAVLGIVNTQ